MKCEGVEMEVNQNSYRRLLKEAKSTQIDSSDFVINKSGSLELAERRLPAKRPFAITRFLASLARKPSAGSRAEQTGLLQGSVDGVLKYKRDTAHNLQVLVGFHEELVKKFGAEIADQALREAEIDIHDRKCSLPASKAVKAYTSAKRQRDEHRSANQERMQPFLYSRDLVIGVRNKKVDWGATIGARHANPIGPFGEKPENARAFLRSTFEKLCIEMPEYNSGKLDRQQLVSVEKQVLDLLSLPGVTEDGLEQKLKRILETENRFGKGVDMLPAARRAAIASSTLPEDAKSFVRVAAKDRSLKSAMDLYTNVREELKSVHEMTEDKVDEILTEAANNSDNAEKLIDSAREKAIRSRLEVWLKPDDHDSLLARNNPGLGGTEELASMSKRLIDELCGRAKNLHKGEHVAYVLEKLYPEVKLFARCPSIAQDFINEAKGLVALGPDEFLRPFLMESLRRSAQSLENTFKKIEEAWHGREQLSAETKLAMCRQSADFAVQSLSRDQAAVPLSDILNSRQHQFIHVHLDATANMTLESWKLALAKRIAEPT